MGEGEVKEMKMRYACVPAPHNECHCYVLQIWTNKSLKHFKKLNKIELLGDGVFRQNLNN